MNPGTLSLILLATAMFSAMGGPVLAPVLPSIKAAYAHIPNIEFWTKTLIAVTGLFSALGAPLFGWLSDRYGRRKALVLALAAWGVSGASGLFPQPFGCLLAGRALLGLSLGGLLAANTAMIADLFVQDRQRHMMGLQSAFSSIGIILGLVVSGWLADAHWRWSFAVFLSAFAVLPFALRLPEPERPASWGAAASASPSTHLPWTGVGLLYGFGFMGMFAFNIVPTQMPFVMKSLGVRTAAGLGLLLAVMPLASAVAGRLYARLSRHVPPWSFFGAVGLVMLAGFFVLSISARHTDILWGLALIGVGFGLAMPHVNVVLARMIPPESRGRVLGGLTSSKYFGQFFSPILLQPVLAGGGYAVMLHVAGWLMMCTALLVWGIGRFQSSASKERL